MQISFAEKSFRAGILIWGAVGVFAYCTLPWFALEYGLFDATLDEYFEALGWKSHHLSLLAPLVLLCLITFSHLRMSREGLGKLLVACTLAAALLICSDFIRTGTSMGLGVCVVLIALAAVFSYGLARLGVLQGDTFISEPLPLSFCSSGFSCFSR